MQRLCGFFQHQAIKKKNTLSHYKAILTINSNSNVFSLNFISFIVSFIKTQFIYCILDYNCLTSSPSSLQYSISSSCNVSICSLTNATGTSINFFLPCFTYPEKITKRLNVTNVIYNYCFVFRKQL